MSFSSFADVKKSFSTQALVRSYPIGAFVKAEGALDWKWWEKENAKVPIMYGLLRPGLTLKTSGVVNTVSPFLEFYPISILGLYIRQSYTNRNMTEIGDFDCNIVQCKADKLSRLTYGIKLALAYKKVFLVTHQKITDITLKDDHTKNFVDETTTMVADKGGDEAYESLVIFGLKVNDIYSVGLFKKDNFMKKTHQQTRMHLLFLSKKTEKYNAMLGVGAFRNRAHKNHGSILFNIKWPIVKGFTLF